MRKLLQIASVLVTVACATHAPRIEARFPEGTGVVLSGENASALARPCSGFSPGRIEGRWSPAQSQIEDLERRLPDVFAAHRGQEWAGLDRRATEYYRQYAGFVIDGRQVIYVHGVVRDLIERDQIIDRRRPSLTWRDIVVSVCDGGAMTFEAVYEVRHRQFSYFAFGDTLPQRRVQ